MISLWGRNLTDEDEITYSAGLGILASGVYERVRSYSVDLSVQF